ncbi:protein kinase domain-containing protein [Acinetobacter sp. ANC 4641]|uniref:protein kinase domain-containing protein n=1 Tax=Acinetobacter sp. ANC 4641 TaxID=2529847 RepID=UPI00103DB550|nr:protein kinase [Acinetobacter sp. ANC 4641]TCB12348.1 hypothetical protein E0H78_03930 [Acinetobacter sp. ANC 4641]
MFDFESLYSVCNKTPRQSQIFGRHIYLLEQAGQHYWLKLQLPHGHTQFQQGFASEVECYGQWQNLQPSFLLPYQYYAELNLPELPQHAQGLLLPHVPEAFSALSQLTHIDIIKRIRMALERLDELHTLGYVHGDIKAAHFRYAAQQMFLIDFEQAQPIHGSNAVLNATPRYMAPELFHAQAKTIQTDLYALGVVLYEWLTQTRLSSKSYLDWAVFHCQSAEFNLPEPWSVLQPCLEGLLARDFKHRFVSAKQASLCLETIKLY